MLTGGFWAGTREVINLVTNMNNIRNIPGRSAFSRFCSFSAFWGRLLKKFSMHEERKMLCHDVFYTVGYTLWYVYRFILRTLVDHKKPDFIFIISCYIRVRKFFEKGHLDHNIIVPSLELKVSTLIKSNGKNSNYCTHETF